MASSSSTALTAQRAKDGLRDAVNDFRRILSEEQRRDFVQFHGVPDVDAVMVFTAKLDHRSKQRAGQSFASRLYNILLSFANFCNIVDTFVQSDPNIAALVWGSIKLTMMVMTNVTSHFLLDAASRLFMQIGILCPIFSEYELLYPDSVRLQSALKNYYASIIRCCRHLVESFGRPWHARIAMGLRTSFEQEFAPDLQDVQMRSDHAKDQIALAKAQADVQHQYLEGKERSRAEKSRIIQSRFFSRTDRVLQGIRSQQLQNNEQARRKRTHKLLTQISSHPYLRPFKESMRKCYSGTTRWVLESQEFKDWLNGTDPVLWCSGKIGSGKTIITSSAIQRTLVVEAATGSSTSFFFAQSGDHDSQNASVILKSLIRQNLNTIDPTPEWLENVASKSTPADLVKPMCELFKQKERRYIFVDGLDECGKDDCQELLGALSTVARSCPNLSLTLTSRDSLQPSIRKHFPNVRRLTIDCDANDEDIAKYVTGSLRERIKAGDLKIRDQSLLQEMEDRLAEGAQGMFLWAFFQLQEICLQHCDEDIRLVLKNLPQDLAETFRRLLHRIQREGHASAAREAFRWIVAARRPMSLDELHEAMAVKVGHQSIDPSRLFNDMDRIPSWTANLVQVGEEDLDVHFVHSSIHHLLTGQLLGASLEGFHVDLKAADGHLGDICVTYLHFSDFQRALVPRQKETHVHPERITDAISRSGSRSIALLAKLRLAPEMDTASFPSNALFRTLVPELPRRSQLRDHPFLSYAARYWIAHTADLSENRGDIWRLWSSLVLDDCGIVELPWSLSGDTVRDMLTWACHNRHYAILRLLCTQKHHKLTVADEILIVAGEESDIDFRIIDLAIRAGPSVEGKELALKAASARGKLPLVKSLLASNARWDTCQSQRTVHGAASELLPESERPRSLTIPFREVGESRRIAAKSAPLPFRGQLKALDDVIKLKSALDLAAEGGHAEVVETFLKNAGHGFRHTKARTLGSALLHASANGHEKIVEQLLEAGVEVNENERPLGIPTALQAAAKAGHEAVVRKLIEAKADVNAEPSQEPGWTAIQAAAHSGHAKIVKLLLDAGADISAPTARADGETALHLAVTSGDPDTVTWILVAMKNFPLDGASWEDKRALRAAHRSGHTAVTRLLEFAKNCVYWDPEGATYRFRYPQYLDLQRL